MRKATHRRKGLFELRVPEGQEGEYGSRSHIDVQAESSEQTGNDTRPLNPQSLPPMTNFSNKPQPLSFAQQHHQLRTKYSKVQDYGGNLIQTTVLVYRHM